MKQGKNADEISISVEIDPWDINIHFKQTTKKTNTTSKWAKDMNRQSTEESTKGQKIKMLNLINKEMQIKERGNFTPPH